MDITDDEILKLVEIIKVTSKYDFSDYTEKSFRRRVEKVVTDNKLSIDDLIKRLKIDKNFLEKTVRDITVNTTEMFRDPNVWITLRDKVLPELKNKESINIWHAGCSSGQEVYSMLVMLNELGLMEKTNVFGTDINTDMIEESKRGVYKYQFNSIYFENFDAVFNAPEDVARRGKLPYDKYFTIDKNKDLILIKDFLKKKPFFRTHDLVNDDNVFGIFFDLIICRNVLIYFNNKLQNRVFDLFHRSLFPDSFLIIGMHESILGPFSTRLEKRGLYYKKRHEY